MHYKHISESMEKMLAVTIDKFEESKSLDDVVRPFLPYLSRCHSTRNVVFVFISLLLLAVVVVVVIIVCCCCESIANSSESIDSKLNSKLKYVQKTQKPNE